MTARRTLVATTRGDIESLVSPVTGGPTVLLLHPLASSGELWRPAIDWLAHRGARVVAPTLPAPAGIAGGKPVTIESMAEDVEALVGALGLDEVRVLGMSMGGCVAQAVALRMAGRLRRLVLVDTTACYGADRVAKWNERAIAARRQDRSSLLPFQLDRWFTQRFQEHHPREVDRIADIFVRCPGEVHAACCFALGEFDFRSRLIRIDVPTRVVVGEDDYATPLAMARQLAEGIPGATLRVLPGIRHMSLLEAPDAWNDVWAFMQDD